MKTYNELKEFNITKLIKKEYELNGNIDRLDSFLEDVDFTELSKKEFKFEWLDDGQLRQEYIQREESLSENIIDSMPFEVYQKYVSYHWLKHKKDEGLIYVALINQNAQLIKRLGEVGLQAYKEKNITEHEYQRLYLEPLLKFSDRLSHSYSKEFLDLLYPLFKDAITKHENIMREFYQNNKTYKNWLTDLPTGVYNKTDAQIVMDNFTTIIKNKNANKFLDDAMTQLKKVVKITKSKTSEDFLLNNNFIELAIENGNMHFIEKLNQLGHVSEKEIKMRFNNFLKDSYIACSKDLYRGGQYTKKLENASNMFHWFKDKEIKNNLELLVFSKDSKIQEYLRNNLNTEKKAFLKDGLNFKVNDLMVVAQMIEEFNSINFKYKLRDSPFLLSVGNELLKNDYKPNYEKTDLDDIKAKFDLVFQDLMTLDRNNKSFDTNSWFTNTYLEKKLKDSEKSPPKIKI